MQKYPRFSSCLLVCALAAASVWPARVAAQSFSFTLDPSSSSLTVIPAGSNDILTGKAPLPGPLPPPAIGYSAADLHLVPGDVIDGLSYGDDGPLGSTLYFSVTRGSVSGPGPFTPNVFSEVTGVPVGIQPEASSDIFSSFDPTCGVFPPFQHARCSTATASHRWRPSPATPVAPSASRS